MILRNNHAYREMVRTALGLFILLWMSFPGICRAATNADETFYRPEATEIRDQVKTILADPKFQVKKSWLQWLLEKFDDWEKPDFKINPIWSKIVSHIIVPWCILTIIAILCHLIWSLWLIFQPGSKIDQRFEATGPESVAGKSFTELLNMAQTFAEQGAFRKAVELLMAALLKGLDAAGMLKFHESKTNGDFMREYSENLPGQNDFKNFVHLFEQTIYGGMVTGDQIYTQMKQLMEQIYIDVREKA